MTTCSECFTERLRHSLDIRIIFPRTNRRQLRFIGAVHTIYIYLLYIFREIILYRSVSDLKIGGDVDRRNF